MKTKTMPRFLRKYFLVRFRRNIIFALLALFLVLPLAAFMFEVLFSLSPHAFSIALPTSASGREVMWAIQREQFLLVGVRVVAAIPFLTAFTSFIVFTCRSILLLKNSKCAPSSKTFRILKQYGDPKSLLRELDSCLDSSEKEDLKRRLLGKGVHMGKQFVMVSYPTHLYIALTADPAV